MASGHGTVEAGDDKAVMICVIPETGAKIRNLGGGRLFVGVTEAVETEGDSAGYPIDAGEREEFRGAPLRESPAVPAPPGDMTPSVLYGRSASGIVRVAWITT